MLKRILKFLNILKLQLHQIIPQVQTAWFEFRTVWTVVNGLKLFGWVVGWTSRLRNRRFILSSHFRSAHSLLV